MTPATPAETVVAAMAREIEDGAVIATGVASPLAILAIAVARATHAPRLAYLACVGALDPEIATLHSCSEDLGYLDGRYGEVTIPDLFDHARRGRIDLMLFGAADLVARHPWATEEEIAGKTDFAFRTSPSLPVTPAPSPEHLRAIRRIDAEGLRDRLIG